MARKLASIQKIDKVEDIPGADFIEKASILGWDVVIKKGEFDGPDSPVVFCEIDSVLPQNAPWAEFMAASKFRVKTKKLRGVISQGLALPLSILPAGDYALDSDVTELLGIKKYEPPQHDGGVKMGKSKGNFPAHLVPKTDETRIQTCLKCLYELGGLPYYITVKCDGTSGTFLYNKEGEFLACSRNFAKKPDDTNVYWQVARKYNLEEKLKDTPWAIQGEIVGPGIQGNKMDLAEVDLRVFNIYNTQTKRYLDFLDFLDVVRELGLIHVPIEEIDIDFKYSKEELLQKTEGKYAGTKNEREGIVVRPQIETYSEKLRGRLSFKVISNRFLLKLKD